MWDPWYGDMKATERSFTHISSPPDVCNIVRMAEMVGNHTRKPDAIDQREPGFQPVFLVGLVTDIPENVIV